MVRFHRTRGGGPWQRCHPPTMLSVPPTRGDGPCDGRTPVPVPHSPRLRYFRRIALQRAHIDTTGQHRPKQSKPTGRRGHRTGHNLNILIFHQLPAQRRQFMPLPVPQIIRHHYIEPLVAAWTCTRRRLTDVGNWRVICSAQSGRTMNCLAGRFPDTACAQAYGRFDSHLHIC